MNDMEKNLISEGTEDFAAMLEETMIKLRPGQVVKGVVAHVSDDGVVVSIPGKADGYIKKNDLVTVDCKVEDEIEAEVVKLNDGEGYVLLSERKVMATKNWEKLVAEHDTGACVEATGREAVNGGLIADVMGVRAFIPASHLSRRFVENIGEFVGKTMTVKIIEVDKSVIDYIDVSPKMVISVATGFIPFLENDDNSRALMGSNMQKQAVPLLKTDAPIVGTGMEYKAAVDSGVTILAAEAGTVTKVCADGITVMGDSGTSRYYELTKFLRSNQGTCINQRPIVDVGQRVEKNEVIADGPATDHGEISLGKNALVGFMTWEGYNYEDAVLINEKLVRDDVYTSIHTEKYELEARDTKLGPEEITNDIPNVGEDALRILRALRFSAVLHTNKFEHSRFFD